MPRRVRYDDRVQRITAITPLAQDPKRATVKVDGRRVATLSVNMIGDIKLAVDQSWDDTLAARVAEAGQYDKAMRAAMQRINRRPLSRAELCGKLRQLGFASAVMKCVVDRLSELSLINDVALGRSLIDEIQRRKPAGPRLLRQKLLQRRLDRVTVDQIVEHECAQRDASADALRLVQSRLRAMNSLDEQTRRRRLWGMLARRGFDTDTIDAALSAVGADGVVGDALW